MILLHREYIRFSTTARNVLASGSRGVTAEEALNLAFAEEMGESRAEGYYRLTKIMARATPLKPGESAAYTYLRPKIAAILFDRISAGVSLWDPDIPVKLLYPNDPLAVVLAFSGDAGPPLCYGSLEADMHGNPSYWEKAIPKAVAELTNALGRPVTPLFSSTKALNTTYTSGNREVLVIALEKLPFLDEQELESGFGDAL